MQNKRAAGAGRYAPGMGHGHVDDALARTGAARGQRSRVAYRPHLRPHAHSPQLQEQNPASKQPRYTAPVNNRSTHFASPISGLSRLKPDLDKTVAALY